MPIVLMHAFDYRGDGASRTVIPCDSGTTAEYWRKVYVDAGWLECWTTGWVTIETLPQGASNV